MFDIYWRTNFLRKLITIEYWTAFFTDYIRFFPPTTMIAYCGYNNVCQTILLGLATNHIILVHISGSRISQSCCLSREWPSLQVVSLLSVNLCDVKINYTYLVYILSSQTSPTEKNCTFRFVVQMWCFSWPTLLNFSAKA